MVKGILQVYTGNGKGKTTAAMGLAVRAWGRGLKVKVFQMLKNPGGSGELFALKALNPPVPCFPLGTGGFIIDRAPTLQEIAKAEEGWRLIEQAVADKSLDLIVIDEISHAINCGLLKLDTVLTVLSSKPPTLEIVLTGSNMPDPLIDLADLVTEMKMVKHPYSEGLSMREGIEY